MHKNDYKWILSHRKRTTAVGNISDGISDDSFSQFKFILCHYLVGDIITILRTVLLILVSVTVGLVA